MVSVMVEDIITPFPVGFDGLLLYRDYCNRAEDASLPGAMPLGRKPPPQSRASEMQCADAKPQPFGIGPCPCCPTNVRNIRAAQRFSKQLQSLQFGCGIRATQRFTRTEAKHSVENNCVSAPLRSRLCDGLALERVQKLMRSCLAGRREPHSLRGLRHLSVLPVCL